MPQITIAFGVLLALLSPVSILAAGHFAPTAMIPAYFGIALIACGLLAMKPHLRMHAIHIAGLVALVGIGGALSRAIPGTLKLARGEPALKVAIISQWLMAALCVAFIGLMVRSFIAARRWKRSQSAA